MTFTRAQYNAVNAFRRTFAAEPYGRRTLGTLLNSHGLFVRTQYLREMAARNPTMVLEGLIQGHELMENLGWLEPEVYDDLVGALLRLPMPQPGEDKSGETT